MDRPERNRSKVIKNRLLERERNKNYEITRIDRFIFKTRYLTDTRIIGTKMFMSTHYQVFKDHFQARKEKKPKAVKGLDGIFSLKGLSEV